MLKLHYVWDVEEAKLFFFFLQVININILISYNPKKKKKISRQERLNTIVLSALLGRVPFNSSS